MNVQVAEIHAGTIVATLIGLVAAAIVFTTLAGMPLPFISSDRVALVALVLVGFGMCVASGIGNPAGTPPPTGIAAAIAGMAGLFSVGVLVSVIAGWTGILDPLSGVIYGKPSDGIADKLGVLTVGILIAIAWLVATLRQVGLLGTVAS